MAKILTGMVGVIHVYFAYLEIFRWTDPKVAAKFGLTAEQALSSASLAANQGFYNFMIAVGLFAAVANPRLVHLSRYLLVFVIAVGVFGAATVATKILWLQSLPALIALVFSYLRSNEA